MYLSDFWRQVDPWQELENIQREMNRMFGDVSGASVNTYPLVNIWANSDNAIITAELPGLSPKDIQVSVQEDMLTLEGTRPGLTLGENDQIHRHERGTGHFKRTIRLPFFPQEDKISAKIEKGCLMLTLPRSEADKPKKITIKTAE